MSHRTVLRLLGRRGTGVIMALSLLAGLVTTISATSAGAVTGACLPGQVSAVASVSSRPGGTTAQLVMTSRQFPHCLWAVPTGYQFLSASGATIGPVVYPVPHPLTTHWVALNYGFQVLARVTTMSGVNCSTQSAAKVRVSAPGQVSPLDVGLPSSIAVCVGGTTAWTSVVESRAVVPRCDTAQLSLSIGAPNGAAGTTYYPLRVRNSARVACSISGFALVRAWRTMKGNPLGPVARRVSLPGYGAAIRLAPGDSASALLGVSNVGNYPPRTCKPAAAVALSVSAASAHLIVPLSLQVCTKQASLSVRAWVPGLSGQV